MCRSIRTLHNFDPPATEEEILAASVQYVRKISGFVKPSKSNEAAFNLAVARIASESRQLLQSLQSSSPPKDRDIEAAKAKERSRERFAG